MIHICVDGYAHCTDNNRAETVLDQFTEGVDTYGLSSRVQSDHGVENFGSAQYMLERKAKYNNW